MGIALWTSFRWLQRYDGRSRLLCTAVIKVAARSLVNMDTTVVLVAPPCIVAIVSTIDLSRISLPELAGKRTHLFLLMEPRNKALSRCFNNSLTDASC